MKENLLQFQIIFLSDSKKTPTNIPYRIRQSLLLYRTNLKIYFISFNYNDLLKLLRIILKLISRNEFVIIHSHHLKSLIINIVIKYISKLLRKKNIISYHTFHCELKRYNQIKLNLIHLSKFIIDEFSCVSKNLKMNWECYLKKEVNFLPIGISSKERESIFKKSKELNQNNLLSKEKDNAIRIAWVGRFEKVKNPLLILKSLRNLNISSNKRIKIIFAGDGKLVPEFKLQLKNFLKSNLKNIEVQYIGMLKREEVIKLIASTNIYVNTSISESFCVCANEFLYNPFCKLILPNIKNLREIYECKRVDFYKVNNEKSLKNIMLKNISYFFKNSSYFNENIYPNDFQNYSLEETTQKLMNSYIAAYKNYKY